MSQRSFRATQNLDSLQPDFLCNKEVKPRPICGLVVGDHFVYRSLELAPTRFDRSESRYAMALAIRWDSIAPTCWSVLVQSENYAEGVR